MARIKILKDHNIVIYIYGEKYGKHHGKHVLVVKTDEDCQYGFDGKPIQGTKGLKNRGDRLAVESWIRRHRSELEKAWEDINSGKNPRMIE